MVDVNYPTTFNPPVNALQMIGQYQGISNAIQQNALLHQQVQQAQVATQQALGKQRVAQIINDNTKNGHTDWLGVKTASAQDPVASMNMDYVNTVADPQLALTQFGVVPPGQPNAGAGISKPLQQVQEATSGGRGQPNGQTTNSGAPANDSSVMTSLPSGYTENQKPLQQHYQDVLSSADSVPKDNAALNNVYNLSKSNAPTGQVLGSFYSYLAAHDIAPPGAQNAAEQLQLIHSHAAQIAQSAGSRSDQDLISKQLATVSESDLPKVIQTMVPYLKAVNNSKVAQASYYRQQEPNGIDPDKIANARSNWQSNSDPRLFEMKELQSNPDELNKYIQGLDPADATQLIAKYRKMNQAGMLGK